MQSAAYYTQLVALIFGIGNGKVQVRGFPVDSERSVAIAYIPCKQIQINNTIIFNTSLV